MKLPDETQYRKVLKRAKESFVTHVMKFNKIGNKGFPLTPEHDIVLWSRKPKSINEFYFAIEDSKRKQVWKSAYYVIPIMNQNHVEETINNAIRDTYLLTVDKFTTGYKH